MSRSELASLWRTRLSDFAASDCSREEWCARHGVTLHQLYYWRKRLATERVPEQGLSNLEAMPCRGPWLAVTFTDPPSVSSAPPSLTLRIAGGEIDLLPGFDPALLRSVVRALGGERC